MNPSPWTWRCYNPPKHRELLIQRHDVISHKTVTFSNTAESTSNDTYINGQPMLRWQHSFVWWLNQDTSENRSEMPWKLWNVMMKTDGADRMDRSMKNRQVLVVQRVKEERNSLCKMTSKEANWIGHILVGIAFWNALLKEKYTGRKDEEGEVYSYWMTFKKKQYIGNWKEKATYCTLEGTQ